MTKEQEDAIYAAYLGVSVLQTMCRKVGLRMAVERSQALLTELGTAFPFIPERVAQSALRAPRIRVANHQLGDKDDAAF